MFYELASSSWGAEEKNAMQRVIDSGMFTMSKNVAEFEKRFAEQFGAKHAVMVSSGSAANLVSLAALFYKKEKPLQISKICRGGLVFMNEMVANASRAAEAVRDILER